MTRIDQKVEEIIKKAEADDSAEQIREFDKLVKKLSVLDDLKPKSQYSFPLIDTLGKRTYASLNKRS